MLTLTTDPSKVPDTEEGLNAIGKAWSKLVSQMRKKWGPVEYVRVYEPHASGRIHIHAVLRSGYIKQEWISEAWEKLGMGEVVWIDKIRHGAGAAGKYISKYLAKTFGRLCMRYPRKRLIQASRGWLDDQARAALVGDPAHTPLAVAPVLDGGYAWLLSELASKGAILTFVDGPRWSRVRVLRSQLARCDIPGIVDLLPWLPETDTTSGSTSLDPPGPSPQEENAIMVQQELYGTTSENLED